MKNNKGFATLFIILAILVVGGGSYALVSRNVLKSFFETGDKPNQEEKKSDTEVEGESAFSGDKPNSSQFGTMIDSTINMTDDRDLTGLKEYNPTKNYQAGDTVVKSNSIYQAKVVTQTNKEFKLDTDQPVTFRWTPVDSKTEKPVTYRLRVWQLMQGQSGSQAMNANKPVVTKEFTGVTEATISGIYTGPCRPPYLCDFVWGVDVLVKEGSDTGSSVSAETDVSVGTSAH